MFAVNLHVVPTGQLHTVGGPTRSIRVAPDPAGSVLAIINAAPLVRYTRASMLEVLNADYVTTARAKGLGHNMVIMRHAFRNGLIPIITIVALLIPEAVAGAVITEQIFAWNGMGQLAVKAAGARDPSMMMGIILITGSPCRPPTSSPTSATPSPIHEWA